MDDLVWLPDGIFYFLTVGDSALRPKLWRGGVGQEAVHVDEASLLECDSDVTIIDIFKHGQALGLAWWCGPGRETRIAAVDPLEGRVADSLVTSPFSLRGVTTSIDGKGYGVATGGNGCRVLIGFDREGLFPIPIHAADGLKLEAHRRIEGGPLTAELCRTAEVQEPLALSTDGRFLVFGAAATAQEGEEFEAVFGVLNPPTANTTSSASKLAELRKFFGRNLLGLALSDDGESVAVSTRVEGGTIHIVDTETGSMNEVASGRHFAITFSPDSTQLAALHSASGEGGRTITLIPTNRGS